jgi:phosphoribosylpyrophosphate synthetase
MLRLPKFGARATHTYITHAVLSDPALKNLRKAGFQRIVMMDPLQLPPHMRTLNINILSIVPIIAEAIHAKASTSQTRNGNPDGSVSRLFSVARMRDLYQKAGIPLGGPGF